MDIGFPIKVTEFDSFKKGEDAKLKKWKDLSKFSNNDMETITSNLNETCPILSISFPLEFGKIEPLAKSIKEILKFEKLEVTNYVLPTASGDKKDLINSLKISLKK